MRYSAHSGVLPMYLFDRVLIRSLYLSYNRKMNLVLLKVYRDRRCMCVVLLYLLHLDVSRIAHCIRVVWGNVEHFRNCDGFGCGEVSIVIVKYLGATVAIFCSPSDVIIYIYNEIA